MQDASGKSSYPHAKKAEMFSHAYKSFAPWHSKVFFYLCMEEHSLWKECFGYEYATNNDFEREMLFSYTQKLGLEFLM
jgi:spore photoproduct lyase